MTMAEQKTEKRTLVEEGTELKGSLKSSCPVLVRGRVEGDVSAPALTVSPSGVFATKFASRSCFMRLAMRPSASSQEIRSQ